MSARINPDSLGVLWVSVAATGALGLTSFMLSYAGLGAAASWARVPEGLAWAVPVTIDGAILVYTLAALVFRARGESATLEWAALGTFAGLSVIANGVHAWDAAPAAVRAVLGVTIAGLAPVAVVLATHTIARLVVARPDVAAVSRETTHEGVATVAGEVVAGRRAPASVPRRRADRAASRDRRAQIVALAADGALSYREIAERVGVSKSTVSRALADAEPAGSPTLFAA